MLQITLTKSAVVDTTDIGYQEPIDESEVQEYNERERLDEGRRSERKRTSALLQLPARRSYRQRLRSTKKRES